jgi:hypothetical protein
VPIDSIDAELSAAEERLAEVRADYANALRTKKRSWKNKFESLKKVWPIKSLLAIIAFHGGMIAGQLVQNPKESYISL